MSFTDFVDDLDDGLKTLDQYITSPQERAELEALKQKNRTSSTTNADVRTTNSGLGIDQNTMIGVAVLAGVGYLVYKLLK